MSDRREEIEQRLREIEAELPSGEGVAGESAERGETGDGDDLAREREALLTELENLD